MANYITVIPAYGADYKSQAAVQEAWDEGKDFKIMSMMQGKHGAYLNKSDKKKYVPNDIITVRYASQTKAYIVK